MFSTVTQHVIEIKNMPGQHSSRSCEKTLIETSAILIPFFKHSPQQQSIMSSFLSLLSIHYYSARCNIDALHQCAPRAKVANVTILSL